MTTWDIHVAEVDQVLRNASASAEDYLADEAAVSASLAQLATALPSSPHVAMRVVEFADEVIHPHLRAIFEDTAAALEGTTQALNAYQTGDLEMARRAHYLASSTTQPDAPGARGALFRVR